MFELPQGQKSPNTNFNKYKTNKKPEKDVRSIIKKLEISLKKHPYAKSDILVWKNIKKLWSKGHNVFIYNIDKKIKAKNKIFYKYWMRLKNF